MRIYKLFERFFLWCIRKTWFFFILIHELKNIFKKRHILSKVKLTDSQKKEIDEFYKENYGKKVYYWWHRLYQSYTGNFDAKYFPEYIFSLWLDNDILKAQPYSNKNMLDVLFNVNEGGELLPLRKLML